MNKSELLTEQFNFAQWVESLKDLDEKLWFQPIESESWSIAEIISHLQMWDQFVLEHRVPYLFTVFPDVNPTDEEVNLPASQYALSGVTQKQLIDGFCLTRTKLIEELEKIAEHDFQKVLKLGHKEITISAYFNYLIEHDLHHKQQISAFIHACDE